MIADFRRGAVAVRNIHHIHRAQGVCLMEPSQIRL